MSDSSSQPGWVQSWWLAARPATLWAGVAPVVVGTACAHSIGGLRWLPAFLALLGAILIQVGTNFANDVLDFDKGADTDERLGPTRAVQAGLLSRDAMWRGTWLVFLAAALCGLGLAWLSGPQILVVGVLSIAAGIAYTAGPYPLAYIGLGELFVVAFFGVVAVVGTVWVQTQTFPENAWLSGVAVGLLSAAILVVNNLRDRPTDATVGKRTLAVRFGIRFSHVEYALLVLAPYALVLVLVQREGPLVALVFVSLPFALTSIRRVSTTSGRALNPLLGATSRLLLAFSALLAIGLWP